MTSREAVRTPGVVVIVGVEKVLLELCPVFRLEPRHEHEDGGGDQEPCPQSPRKQVTVEERGDDQSQRDAGCDPNQPLHLEIPVRVGFATRWTALALPGPHCEVDDDANDRDLHRDDQQNQDYLGRSDLLEHVGSLGHRADARAEAR